MNAQHLHGCAATMHALGERRRLCNWPTRYNKDLVLFSTAAKFFHLLLRVLGTESRTPMKKVEDADPASPGMGRNPYFTNGRTKQIRRRIVIRVSAWRKEKMESSSGLRSNAPAQVMENELLFCSGLGTFRSGCVAFFFE